MGFPMVFPLKPPFPMGFIAINLPRDRKKSTRPHVVKRGADGAPRPEDGAADVALRDHGHLKARHETKQSS